MLTKRLDNSLPHPKMFRRAIFILGVTCWFLAKEARASIVLFGNGTTSYPSMDASFTQPIPEAGILGEVYPAEPLNGCSALLVNATAAVAFSVVERGECTFEIKVRNAQDAGFTAVIVFDDKSRNTELVTMGGNGEGITIYALFVSKEAGEQLLSHEGTVYILPGYKKNTWTIKWLILSVSAIIIVIVCAIITALCCIRHHILAEAEKEAYEEKLLQDDEYILNREFIPDDLGPEGLGAKDAVTDTEGENSDFKFSEGPSDSDRGSDVSVNTVLKL